MSSSIPFIKPKFPDPEELTVYIKRIYKNNYYSNNGPIYFEFKEAIEAYLGQGIKAVVVSNATLGLMLAIQAGIKQTGPKKKKYIAVPSFTFAAGPLAIKWCGFEPIFFDVDSESTQPSLESFQSLLDAHPEDLAGVLLVNNFGIGNKDVAVWKDLLISRDLPFVIDSAPGFGSTYADGNLVGAQGVCEVFSLHATKPFGIGEGGLITTRDTALAEELESLKNFGFDDDKQTVYQGINAKITEIDCAIGLCQLREYPATLADRRSTYQRFKANLQSYAVSFLPRAETSAIQFATIVVEAEKRPKVLKTLKAAGVGTGTYYAPAVHTFPFFKEYPTTSLKHTDLLSSKVISLPLHPNMEASTVDYICDMVIKGLE